MAKTITRKPTKKQGFVPDAELPHKINYMIIIAGVVTVIIGYLVMMAGGTVDPLSITIAPIILVIGYCVIIPIGIIYKKKNPETAK